MPELLRMPEVAAGTSSARLAEWLVEEGSQVAAGQPLALVETDKATLDLTTPGPVRLVRQLAEPGVEVETGAPIALLAAPDEVLEDPEAALAALGVPASSGTGAGPGDPPAHPPAPKPPELPERRFASPLARRLAARAGIPLEAIPGSGPGGTPGDEGTRRIPHSRMRRAIATRLAAAAAEVPQFTVRSTLRAEPLETFRRQLLEAGVKVTLSTLLVKAAALAHRRVPGLHVRFAPDALEVPASVDVGLAVATDQGLVAPVVREVDRRSLAELDREVAALIERARAGQLRQVELEGGTITVSNLGMYGVEEFSAVVNPPQAAILAVGALQWAPVVDRDGHLAAGRVLRCTLTVDHRAADGAVAAQWMTALGELLEHPLALAG
jgi:pyruvate dehydrogenase E2 component (dihydrolipoamide acetyltransferase)